MIAATMPIQATISEKILSTPPRTLGAMANRNPMTPKPMATIASINPVPALTKKLAIAAPIAMIDGRLKCGLF